ncbi:L domain-like protein [Teratosphaeria nubilosa]|uniref:U2 small nuclear ribonucleoprotein A' n=1 Tax=Teratosphaeria nubilosa TaxID=161662 RepID=A0A6G1LEW6_9PEZI|nr:L domain-like protein [Teratosphaeria nubilosa]
MRLTAELVHSSLSYNNALNERELDLRGHKIPAIENLGVAKDHEAIDLTDNDISALANFPLSPRLHTLLCARNRIARIQPSLGKSVPGLRTLVLTDNLVAELGELDALQGCAKLEHVSLVGCPVTRREHYRYYLLWRAPHIRFLDFHKVKDAERAKATDLFGTHHAPSALAQQIMATRSTGGAGYAAPPRNGVARGKRLQLTEREKARYSALVNKATTLAEVQRLEKMLNEGRLPPGVAEEEAMDLS